MLRWMAALTSAWVLAVAAAGEVRADSITIEFERVTNNAAQDLSSQLYVEVSAYGTDQVLFVVHNGLPTGTSGVVSSICDVYWGPKVGTDPATVAGILGTTVAMDTATTSSGVSFADGATPTNAPGGSWTAGASADSNSPIRPNGIALHESGGFLLTLLSGKSWSDVVSSVSSGGLRMAFHVQGIGTNGQSDTYESVVAVPEPTTLALLGLGLAGIVVRRRR